MFIYQIVQDYCTKYTISYVCASPILPDEALCIFVTGLRFNTARLQFRQILIKCRIDTPGGEFASQEVCLWPGCLGQPICYEAGNFRRNSLYVRLVVERWHLSFPCQSRFRKMGDLEICSHLGFIHLVEYIPNFCEAHPALD